MKHSSADDLSAETNTRNVAVFPTCGTGIPFRQQPRYKQLLGCSYCPVFTLRMQPAFGSTLSCALTRTGTLPIKIPHRCNACSLFPDGTLQQTRYEQEQPKAAHAQHKQASPIWKRGVTCQCEQNEVKANNFGLRENVCDTRTAPCRDN